MSGVFQRTRSANVVGTTVFALLVGVALVLVLLPAEYALWLAGVWTVLAVIGNVACVQAVRTRWKQRQQVLNPQRLIAAKRRKALLSIANANVRRELVRGAEFGVLLLLGVAVLIGWSTPLIGRGVIVLVLVMLLANVIYDLLEMAYTDQFLDVASPSEDPPEAAV